MSRDGWTYWTGFETSVGESIESVFTRSREIIDKIAGHTNYLTYWLRYYWSSPNAVEFSKKYNPMMAQTLNNAIDSVKALCEKSRNAYNAMASANGAPTLGPIDYYTGTTVWFDFYTNYPDQGGLVGIHPNTYSWAESFEKDVEKRLKQFSDIAVEIALYDPDNALAYSYRVSWNEIVENIRTSVKEVCSAVKQAIETEVKSMDLTVERAVQTLGIHNPYSPL